VELGPFDYENENYTRALWFSEGFTEYYGALMLVRAGITKPEEYLKGASMIEKLQTTPGRLAQSVELASFDAWIKLYRPDENTVNSAISYYVKGAVIAFLFDAKLRAEGDSLDERMRQWYEQHSGECGFSVIDEPWLTAAIETTEELDYSLWPVADAQQPQLPGGELDSAPIAKALLTLRAALIDGARKSAPGPQACFTDYDPSKPGSDAGNSFKLGLSFVNDVTGGFEVTVGVVDLNGSIESKGTTGNTLTVAFVQRGLPEIQTLKDEATKECAFPSRGTPLCDVATAALSLVTAPNPEADDRRLVQAVENLCQSAKAPTAAGSDCGKAKALQQIAEERIGKGLGIR